MTGMKEYIWAVLLKYKIWSSNSLWFGLCNFCNVPAKMFLSLQNLKKEKVYLSFICLIFWKYAAFLYVILQKDVSLLVSGWKKMPHLEAKDQLLLSKPAASPFQHLGTWEGEGRKILPASLSCKMHGTTATIMDKWRNIPLTERG